MRRLVVVLSALLFVLGVAGAARADLAPEDACTSPGQPCQNAGPGPVFNHPGTCTALTCSKRVATADGGSMMISYACNLCEAPSSDGGNDATGGLTGTDASVTGTGGLSGQACNCGSSGCAVAGSSADLGGLILLLGSVLGLALRRRRGLRSSLWLAVPFLVAAAGVARADVPPADTCTSPGQPCQNGGTAYNQVGTCVATTCTKYIFADGAATPLNTYPCNRCEAAADAAVASTGGFFGVDGSGGGGGGGGQGNPAASGTAGSTGTGGSTATGGTPGSGGSTSSGGSSGCAVAARQAGDAGGSGALALVAIGLALAVRRRHART